MVTPVDEQPIFLDENPFGFQEFRPQTVILPAPRPPTIIMPPPTPIRVLAPTPIIIEEEEFPKDTSQSKLLTKPLQRAKINWLCRREVCGFINLVWVIIFSSLALAIMTVAITITVYRCRVVKVEAETTTLQAGQFVGQSCTQSSDCLENGYCSSSNVCQCAPDFYYNEEVGQCLALRTFGLNCIDSRECNSFAHLKCIDSKFFISFV